MEKKLKRKPPDEDDLKTNSKNTYSVHKGWADMPPYVKGVIIAGTTIAILWASGYAFTAIAGAISGFKRLRQSIREA